MRCHRENTIQFYTSSQTTYLDRRQNPGVDEQLSGIFLMSRRDVWDEPFLGVKQNFSQRRHYLSTNIISNDLTSQL